MLRLANIFRFGAHLLKANSAHSLHSPFVFDFYRKVLRGPVPPPCRDIAALRRQLMRSDAAIAFEDMGAGRRSGTLKVAGLARRGARRPAAGALLHRLCARYRPQRCLELGTQLGISALYQHSAVPESRFISLEGSEALARMAAAHVAAFGLNTEIRVGEFSQLLETLVAEGYRPDYVLIDGNHNRAATLAYFYRLLPHLPDEAILVFDDIRWSEEMLEAWREISAHAEVSLSIDLFWMGICFIRRPQAKSLFRLRFFNL